MGWIEELHGEVVYVDTAPFIGFIERNPAYVDMLRPFFTSVEDKKISAVTSVVTLLEVLVHPIRDSDAELAKKYQDILSDSTGFSVDDVTRQIVEEAARLRAFYNVRTPDSIHMATAIVSEAKYFLTNDLSLPSLPNLTVLKLDQLKALPEYTEQNENQ